MFLFLLVFSLVRFKFFSVVFFFFQAEDGIRDRTVTGVQTCALPICLRMERYERPPLGTFHAQAGEPSGRPRPEPDDDAPDEEAHPGQADGRGVLEAQRSEERRVGKEWRSGGARWHERKRGRWVGDVG